MSQVFLGMLTGGCVPAVFTHEFVSVSLPDFPCKVAWAEQNHLADIGNWEPSMLVCRSWKNVVAVRASKIVWMFQIKIYIPVEEPWDNWFHVIHMLFWIRRMSFQVFLCVNLQLLSCKQFKSSSSSVFDETPCTACPMSSSNMSVPVSWKKWVGHAEWTISFLQPNKWIPWLLNVSVSAPPAFSCPCRCPAQQFRWRYFWENAWLGGWYGSFLR